ncbi:sugar-binding transcriptional regulator [Bombilactobacillus bombi]|uniref:sugar-binding transcriptional regulator n=1 Tax=Bombilactobacillus bombi TaxID=1303590 RepID=UPI0015E5A02E|nr:sugar-binding domain-containing protein [Bombilactobacillus bombi]MBA1434659.1 SorC family transcriptional regulator [Bombilactobacillus bombi]
MDTDLKLIESIAPDFLQTVQWRYRILQRISWMQPVGRRILAADLGTSERALRRETDLFRNSGLLDSSKSGMSLTAKGSKLVQQLSELMNRLRDTSAISEQLASLFGISRVVILPGNSEQYHGVLDLMGHQLNNLLASLLPGGRSIIAVMGGTTMAAVSESLSPDLSAERNLLFVPARGGLGETMAIQANTVCAEMATRSGGRYRNLYVPEELSAKSVAPLLQEPVVKSVLDLINHADVVIHSIGRAKTMANRRNMTTAEINLLAQRQAVAEAFGDFLDAQGQVVYKVPKIGLQISDLNDISHVIAIAGGPKKAAAIAAYMKVAPQQTVLITDEAASEMILRDKNL